MCFSFSASVTAGATLCVAGALTVRLAQRRADLPLALIPLLFGVQQLAEAAVWWSLEHDAVALDAAATVVYLMFALVWWPVFVPLAVLSAEVVRWRRTVLTVCAALGSVVALDGLLRVVTGPGTPHVVGSSIQYAAPHAWVVTAYLVATCIGTAFSSQRLLRLMGITALGLALVALWLYTGVFVSVWCFFCAVMALLLLAYFVSLRRTARVGVEV